MVKSIEILSILPSAHFWSFNVFFKKVFTAFAVSLRVTEESILVSLGNITLYGVNCSSVEPFPNFPYSFFPQQYKSPFVVMATDLLKYKYNSLTFSNILTGVY